MPDTPVITPNNENQTGVNGSTFVGGDQGGSNAITPIVNSTITSGNYPTTSTTPATPPAVTAITSSALQPATPTPYVSPNPTPIPSVASLETMSTPALTETPEETQESDLSQRLESLNDQLVGKSAYQTQADTDAGVDTLTQQQNDLSTQLSQLKNEALAIPQQLQVDATGRGITADGLAPLQTARLRTNSIAALGVSSMLDASQGLLASAQAKADKAVAAKYDPIQEQIDAATANLKAIQNDPQTSLDDKNRAQAQLDVQNAKAAQLATAKQNSADVLTASITAAKNGADAATLQKMQQAPDGQTALQIATAAGYGNSNISDLMTKYPDAAIAPGDTLQQAQAKVLASPSYTLAQKSAVLDNEVRESSIAKNNADIAAETGSASGTVQLTDPNGNNVSVPTDVAPYYNTSSNGTPYVDASALEGTAADKTKIIQEATAAGLKVITNKNTAADLVNIQDANSKLDTISTIMAGLDQPGVLTTGLNNLGLTSLASITQTDPQKAASGALQAVGLDILKAISGVQGFRGNATVINQINDHMPTIYDTTETAAQKIDYIKQLITDRENAILGTPATGPDLAGFENGGTGATNSDTTSNGVDLTQFAQ